MNTIIIRFDDTGEHRVPGPDGTEAQAYYTDDCEDAIETARSIYGQRVCGGGPCHAPDAGRLRRASCGARRALVGTHGQSCRGAPVPAGSRDLELRQPFRRASAWMMNRELDD